MAIKLIFWYLNTYQYRRNRASRNPTSNCCRSREIEISLRLNIHIVRPSTTTETPEIKKKFHFNQQRTSSTEVRSEDRIVGIYHNTFAHSIQEISDRAGLPFTTCRCLYRLRTSVGRCTYNLVK